MSAFENRQRTFAIGTTWVQVLPRDPYRHWIKIQPLEDMHVAYYDLEEGEVEPPAEVGFWTQKQGVFTKEGCIPASALWVKMATTPSNCTFDFSSGAIAQVDYNKELV